MALLTTVSIPVTVPAVAGLNLTVSGRVCDAFSVDGAVIPETLNPVPVMETEEICVGPLPVLLSVSCCVVELPAATLSKLRLAGEELSCPTGAAEPVPVREILAEGAAGSLLLIAIVPRSAPTAVGRNERPRVAA